MMIPTGKNLKAFVAVPAALLLAAVSGPAASQIVDSAGAQVVDRDVPYVPTPQDVVNLMLEMGDAGPDDIHYDLGSGDGRIVITAKKDFNVKKTTGVDIDPERIRESRANAKKAGVADEVTFIQGDLFEQDFSDATLLTMYLLPSVNMKLRPKILSDMAPGTRVVSHDFDMGDWEPDAHQSRGRHDVYMWVVPADIDGSWRGDAGDGEMGLDIRQEFQEIEGEVEVFGSQAPIKNATLNGKDLEFTALVQRDGEEMEAHFEGEATDERIEGTLEVGGETISVSLHPLA